MMKITKPLYFAKRLIRIIDALSSRRKASVLFEEHHLQFTAPRWWNTASQDIFDDEILPYFSAVRGNTLVCVIDIGAAEGHFAIACATAYPDAAIYAFEPALRQRILLRRNASENGIKNVVVLPVGLWKEPTVLPFRTNGAESSFAPASRFNGTLEFAETLRVSSLDHWAKGQGLTSIDLIKMDAEGAELEILEGAREVLARFRPRLLIQSYHLRDGVRTFERCADFLRSLDYLVEERPPYEGLLHAFRPASAS